MCVYETVELNMKLLFQKNEIEVTYCSRDKYCALSPSPGQRQVSHSDVHCGMLGMLFAIIHDTVVPYLSPAIQRFPIAQNSLQIAAQSLRNSIACVKFLFYAAHFNSRQYILFQNSYGMTRRAATWFPFWIQKCVGAPNLVWKVNPSQRTVAREQLFLMEPSFA